MTEAAFRKLALSLPGATESSHMSHADFRVKGKIFATLPYEGDEDAKDNIPGGVGVLKLTPDQQDKFTEASPKCFEPVKGGWGLRGYTRVRLRATSVAILREALEVAWTNTAPRNFVIAQAHSKNATDRKKRLRAR